MASSDQGAICLTMLEKSDDSTRSEVHTYRYSAAQWTAIKNGFSGTQASYATVASAFGASSISGLVGDYDLTPVNPANYGVVFMDYFGCESGTTSAGTKWNNNCVGW